MNKADLVQELEKLLGSRKTANDALDAVLDTIVREVARGGKVAITGFGTFDRAQLQRGYKVYKEVCSA